MNDRKPIQVITTGCYTDEQGRLWKLCTNPTCTDPRGLVDEKFGWRRMDKEGTTIRPQAQCVTCRNASTYRARHAEA